ncbi:bifunctional phosphoribosyl-AMP cyclohydrolase/phosphoribosyl-ATP diphosphatase HisIE [Gallibacterium genomosp. 1]|uniref:Histidine biosynthesis bifunctional protein HisIE n=1 Tax=Gallibacterium genomosp. 1 TaxID=155515 RepID=A0AB36DYB7_9PAST|nr:bifunctional phosphoribosyl-AMP cyclohydrolase/phosphoribosyl-ATP diphosphatase HisIE [Gallibacterium genomosp. 1]OBX02596.1 phosphoribosyl-ATP pyrophosphatase [Gallibacterium genomosp. 1]OBX03330.1 phosphoribosyl-ATP pyrophosphatase [Gallibacterium genomosp. 1]
MSNKLLTEQINWQKVGGLLPVIVQNAITCEVLMLGYMNAEALEKTLAERKVTFYSRTKQRLWTKGETSGNFLNVVDYTLDCDCDTLLILANPIGATCHEGTDSCFSPVSETPNWIFLSKLEKLLNARKNADPKSSYTASLYARGTKRIAQKVGEEGVETALAATVKDREETICEAADLVYHLTVLLQDADLDWSDVIEKLKERHK